MVGVGATGAGHHATLVLQQVFMGKAPAPLAVDDVHAVALAARHRPGISGVYAGRCRIEVTLAGGEVSRDRWGVVRVWQRGGARPGTLFAPAENRLQGCPMAAEHLGE